MDYPSVNQAAEAVVRLYEEQLKEWNPDVVNIDYTTADILTYVDKLPDLCMLV